MKRIFSTLCLALLSLTALADEGMWLPSLISSRIDDMRAKGFQLTAEDIYSINKASLKDAVMLFDDGCTAELISPGRIADYQPPLRLRSDPAPVVRRARTI